MSHLTPVIIEYRGNPKQYVSVVLDAINLGRLTYDGVANCEQTFRALASVVDVISPKNGKTLSVETLVSYEKKKRAGEFEEKLYRIMTTKPLDLKKEDEQHDKERN